MNRKPYNKSANNYKPIISSNLAPMAAKGADADLNMFHQPRRKSRGNKSVGQIASRLRVANAMMLKDIEKLGITIYQMIQDLKMQEYKTRLTKILEEYTHLSKQMGITKFSLKEESVEDDAVKKKPESKKNPRKDLCILLCTLGKTVKEILSMVDEQDKNYPVFLHANGEIFGLFQNFIHPGSPHIHPIKNHEAVELEKKEEYYRELLTDAYTTFFSLVPTENRLSSLRVSLPNLIYYYYRVIVNYKKDPLLEYYFYELVEVMKLVDQAPEVDIQSGPFRTFSRWIFSRAANILYQFLQKDELLKKSPKLTALISPKSELITFEQLRLRVTWALRFFIAARKSRRQIYANTSISIRSNEDCTILKPLVSYQLSETDKVTSTACTLINTITSMLNPSNSIRKLSLRRTLSKLESAFGLKKLLKDLLTVLTQVRRDVAEAFKNGTTFNVLQISNIRVYLKSLLAENMTHKNPVISEKILELRSCLEDLVKVMDEITILPQGSNLSRSSTPIHFPITTIITLMKKNCWPENDYTLDEELRTTDREIPSQPNWNTALLSGFSPRLDQSISHLPVSRERGTVILSLLIVLPFLSPMAGQKINHNWDRIVRSSERLEHELKNWILGKTNNFPNPSAFKSLVFNGYRDLQDLTKLSFFQTIVQQHREFDRLGLVADVLLNNGRYLQELAKQKEAVKGRNRGSYREILEMGHLGLRARKTYNQTVANERDLPSVFK